MIINNTFEAIFSRLQTIKLPIAQHYTNGLTDEEIRTLLKDFPFRLPTEVYHYYQFCKPLAVGRQDEYLFFPWGYVISLSEALRTREIYITIENSPEIINDKKYKLQEYTSNQYEIFKRPRLWDPRWLPIFSHDGPEHWIVICDEVDRATSPVYFLEVTSDEEFYLAYDNLTTMLLTIVEAFEVGAYYVTDDGDLGQYRTLLSPIFTKYNPECRAYYLRSVGVEDVKDLLNLLDTTDYSLQLKVQRALRILSDSSTVMSLIDVLQNNNANTRMIAAELLGEMVDERAIEPLLKVLVDDPVEATRIVAAEALGKLRNQQAIDALISTLKSPSIPLRTAVIAAIGALPDPRSVDALIDLLDENDTATQLSAIHALSVLGDLRAVGPLTLKLSSRNLEIRQATQDTLNWLKSRTSEIT